jgi:hypothetical protein
MKTCCTLCINFLPSRFDLCTDHDENRSRVVKGVITRYVSGKLSENSIPRLFIFPIIQYFLLLKTNELQLQHLQSLPLAHITNKLNRTKILSEFEFHIFVAVESFLKASKCVLVIYSLPIHTTDTAHTASAN